MLKPALQVDFSPQMRLDMPVSRRGRTGGILRISRAQKARTTRGFPYRWAAL